MLHFLCFTLASACIVQGGNDFSDDPAEFNDLQYPQRPAMLVLVRVEEPKIVFDPPLSDIQDIIHSCFNDIIDGAKHLPRVSSSDSTFFDLLCNLLC